MNNDLNHDRSDRDRPGHDHVEGPDRDLYRSAIDPSTSSAHLPPSGRWSILTESGAYYLIDCDAWTLSRHVNDGPPRVLRRDGEHLRLLGVASCSLGESAAFLIAVRPGVITVRTTTPVLAIAPDTSTSAREAATPRAGDGVAAGCTR